MCSYTIEIACQKMLLHKGECIQIYTSKIYIQTSLLGSIAYNMNGTIQDTDKTMLNMYSVHRFFLEILEEMQAIVTSDQQKNYILNWEPKLAITFINAVKYYLNQQPSLFSQILEKYTKKDIYFVDNDSAVVKKERKKSVKEEKSTIRAQSIKEEVVSHNQEAVENVKKEQNDWDDIQDYLELEEATKQQSVTHSQKKEEPNFTNRQSVKEEAESEFHPPQDQGIKTDSEDHEEEDNDEFYQKAYEKSNAIIYGNFTSRSLKRKPRMDDRISVELTNCFVKMISNGRDAFFDRVQVDLFKIEKSKLKL